MTTATSASRSVRNVSRAEWIALWLLVVSIAINYADRGNLSVAGVALQSELRTIYGDKLANGHKAFRVRFAVNGS